MPILWGFFIEGIIDINFQSLSRPCPNLTFLSIRQIKNYLVLTPRVSFLAHTRATDACTELIKLAFEMNKLPIDQLTKALVNT